MTKLRPPLSFEDGITRIAGAMGWDAAAKAIGKEDRTLRAYSDPDDPRQLCLQDALLLDAAFHAAGGEGAPLHEAYTLQLDLKLRTSAACSDELARRAGVAAIESGQAVAALIATTRPGAGAAERAIAVREVRDGLDALRDTLPLLEADPPIDSS